MAFFLFCTPMDFISFNGAISKADLPVLTADNRGFKYGDGIFETMRMYAGQILLHNLHFHRLLNSLTVLKISHPADFVTALSSAILGLSVKNGAGHSSKTRLAVFRNTNNTAGFVIEQFSLQDPFYSWNEEGWRLSVYDAAIKSRDSFANLKSSNYLPYLMARLHADESGVDESLVLNEAGTIADGSHTNIFLVKGAEISTPALSSGCVDGVMRRFIIARLKDRGQVVRETNVHVPDLENADEVFLTNAIQGVRWVARFGNKTLASTVSRSIFELLSLIRPSEIS